MRELIALLLIIVICIIVGGSAVTEGFSSHEKNWYRSKQCKYQMISVLKNMIDSHKLNEGSDDSWGVYLPCGYNYSQQELNSLKPTSPDQKIFIIKGCDNLSRKDNLWEHLESKYGAKKASKLMPRTYVLLGDKDLEEFKKEYSHDKVYILKKNIQRQNGLKMTSDKQEILQGINKGFVVVQEMLQDPFTIEGRKTNCRVYLLVVCKNGRKRGYIYTDGFMYYTPKSFRVNSTDKDRVITTGYIDRKVYEKNPLTLQDLATYLEKTGQLKDGQEIFKRVGKLMARTLEAVSPSFCTQSNVSKQTTFQLFGCDVAFNDKLEAQLIEINKGPDLGAKDGRDKVVKQGVIDDIFRVVGILDGSHKFMRIWR